MPFIRFIAMLAVLVAAPLMLAACGGDDGGGDDEDQITEAIQVSATSTNPEDCTKLSTQTFMEQTQQATGEDAVAQCEADAEDDSDDPDSVEVSAVSVDGDSATADATFSGGGFDGSTLSVALVKEGDQWRLDEITDIPELNLDAFKTAFAEQIAQTSDIPPQIADCINGVVQGLDENQVKDIILSGSEDALTELLGECLPQG